MNVFTGGSFDLFHAGHVNFLRACKKLAGAGKVTVALNDSEFIRQYKGKAPIIENQDRKTILEACVYVDNVIWNTGGKDSSETLRLTYRGLNSSQYDSRPLVGFPDIIAIGDDWAKKDYYAQMGFTQEWLDQRGILLCYIPYTAGISSTEIKERLRAN